MLRNLNRYLNRNKNRNLLPILTQTPISKSKPKPKPKPMLTQTPISKPKPKPKLILTNISKPLRYQNRYRYQKFQFILNRYRNRKISDPYLFRQYALVYVVHLPNQFSVVASNSSGRVKLKLFVYEIVNFFFNDQIVCLLLVTSKFRL